MDVWMWLKSIKFRRKDLDSRGIRAGWQGTKEALCRVEEAR